jgi:hypothetical protein
MTRKFGPGLNGGRGFAISDASGFLVRAQDRTRDVRQGVVARREADWSGSRFGTRHPLDLFDPGDLSDPKPIPSARPGDPSAGLTAISPVNVPLHRIDGFTPEGDT